VSLPPESEVAGGQTAFRSDCDQSDRPPAGRTMV